MIIVSAFSPMTFRQTVTNNLIGKIAKVVKNVCIISVSVTGDLSSNFKFKI
jgi:hypothetical protein